MATPQTREETELGLLTDLERKDEWIKAFQACIFPVFIPSFPTAEEVERAAVDLISDIQITNKKTFHRWKPSHPKAVPWWNLACALAIQNLHDAQLSET